MIRGTENLRIGDLLSRRVPFEVPVYQRAYAWETEEVEDFIRDLQVLYEARMNDPDNPRNHFFGGLVSIDRFAGNTATGRIYEVVDGQQRLATFMITIGLLVQALNDLATQAEDEGDLETAQSARAHAEHTRREYLKYSEVENGQLRECLRLRLSKADHVFFEQLIDGSPANPSRESHKRLKSAYRKIWRSLFAAILEDATISTREKLQCLLRLRSCVTEDCHVIHIVSDDRNEAYRLFAILNDRGRTLTDGDLLRSHTLELLDGHQEFQEQVERYWDDILSSSEAEIDKFLRSYYASYVGERAPRRDLFDHFRQHFFNYKPPLGNEDISEIERRVASIKAESDTFSKIMNGEWPYDTSKVSAWDRDRLYRLIRVLRHTLCVPLLLSAHHCLDEQAFSELVNLLERFVFRYIIIVGAHPMPLAERYYKYATAIRANPGDYRLSDLEADLRALAADDAQDDLFKVNLEGKLNYSQSSQRRIIKHFLTTLEDHYMWFKNGAPGKPKPDRTASFDLNQISIEHIYPQNAVTPIQALEPLKHDIGNLTFWAPNDNRAAGNLPFVDKRERYAESAVRLTRELANLCDWTEQSLNERRERLIEMALKVFAI